MKEMAKHTNAKEDYGKMKTYYFDCQSVPHIKDTFSLCLGYFDGVHIGHQKMIAQSKNEGYKTALLTFDVNPLLTLGKIENDVYLTSLKDKEEILLKLGVDYLFVLKFDKKCSDLTDTEFIEKILLAINPEVVFCGEDYSFGKNGSGDVQLLSKFIKTIIVPFVKVDGRKVSSSTILDLIKSNKIEQANALLGREYSIKGTIVKGLQNGRNLGFPTANITGKNYLLPACGVYYTKVLLNGEIYDGITNVGRHPSIDVLNEEIIETHILKANDIDLYGKDINLYFVKKIRDEQKFDSKNSLTNQMQKDKEFVFNLIERNNKK